MSFAVRVPEDYVWLMGRFVAEGQSIVPGAPLMDIMTPEGVVETIKAECWGIIAHVEGHRVFPNANSNDTNDDEFDDEDNGDNEDDSDDGEAGSGRSSSGGMGVVFSKGDVICHIVSRGQRGFGKLAGLHPRASPALRLRRSMGMAVG